MRHRHADLIIAWANGAEIECRQVDGIWDVVDTPNWSVHCEYRIKPAPKPDVVASGHVSPSAFSTGILPYGPMNLRLTFDGETGKLKAAEVLETE